MVAQDRGNDRPQVAGSGAHVAEAIGLFHAVAPLEPISED
jgi:hypothetical protein